MKLINVIYDNKTNITLEHFIHETDEWLLFPHELSGLTKDEIREGKSDIANVLDVIL